MAKDFLDEVIAARSKKNPRFPDLVAEAERRRAQATRRPRLFSPPELTGHGLVLDGCSRQMGRPSPPAGRQGCDSLISSKMSHWPFAVGLTRRVSGLVYFLSSE